MLPPEHTSQPSSSAVPKQSPLQSLSAPGTKPVSPSEHIPQSSVMARPLHTLLQSYPAFKLSERLLTQSSA